MRFENLDNRSKTERMRREACVRAPVVNIVEIALLISNFNEL